MILFWTEWSAWENARRIKEYCEKIKRISIDNGYSTTEFRKAQMAYGEFKIIIEPY